MLKSARSRVDAAKVELGERGPVWWDVWGPDYNHCRVDLSPYAEGERDRKERIDQERRLDKLRQNLMRNLGRWERAQCLREFIQATVEASSPDEASQMHWRCGLAGQRNKWSCLIHQK